MEKTKSKKNKKGIKVQFNLMGLDSLSFEKEFETLEIAKEFYTQAREIFDEATIGKTQDRYRNNSFNKNKPANDPNSPPSEVQKKWLRKLNLKIPATKKEATMALEIGFKNQPKRTNY